MAGTDAELSRVLKYCHSLVYSIFSPICMLFFWEDDPLNFFNNQIFFFVRAFAPNLPTLV